MQIQRRHLLGAGAALAVPGIATASSAPINIVFADFPPYTVADAARPGILNEVAVEILRMLGRNAELRLLPWAEAQARGREDANTLITPLGRIPAREPHYTWIVKVLDLEAAFGSMGRTGPLDLAAARQVSRVGVIAGSLHEGFLREQGFTNLVHVTNADAIGALAAGQVDALYNQSLELRWRARQINRAGDLHIGPRLQTVEAFIATGRAASGIPVGEMREAFSALESEGAVERVVRSYVG